MSEMSELPKKNVDDYVAWLRYQHDATGRSWLTVCDSDAPRAFKVYRREEESKCPAAVETSDAAPASKFIPIVDHGTATNGGISISKLSPLEAFGSCDTSICNDANWLRDTAEAALKQVAGKESNGTRGKGNRDEPDRQRLCD